MFYIVMFENKPFLVFHTINDATAYIDADPRPQDYSICEVKGGKTPRYPIGTKVKPNDFYALAQALDIPKDAIGTVIAHKFNNDLNQMDNMVKFEGMVKFNGIAPCSDCELDLAE